MKYFITCLFVGGILFSNALPASKPHVLLTENINDESTVESTTPAAKYFDQDIDHLGEKGGTFKQLYYESLCEEEDDNNLKFLFIGGESALSTGSVVMNFMSQLADQFLADKYALEHRYYGQSQPKESITTENLKYLTIEQTLEDIKTFIEFVNSNTPDVHNKWILFGGSYAGNLAVWARMQYPDLILGAVASSAPVQAELNFKDYLENVTNIIDKTDAQCTATIKLAMNTLVHSFSTKAGKEKLKSQFRMCQLPKNQYDKYSLTSFIAEIFTDAVEYNKQALTGDRLSLLCTDLKNRKGDNLEKLASLIADHYAIGSGCFNYNYNANKDLFQTKINEYSFERQWYYQKCTELGYFQTTGSNNQPFAHSLPLLYYTRICRDAFGKSFSEKTMQAGVEKTNSKYKGKNLANITNVLMVYGSSDPWISLGVLSFTTEKSKAIVIPDGWHCQDMVMASEDDPEELKKGREEVTNIIEHWISL